MNHCKIFASAKTVGDKIKFYILFMPIFSDINSKIFTIFLHHEQFEISPIFLIFFVFRWFFFEIYSIQRSKRNFVIISNICIHQHTNTQKPTFLLATSKRTTFIFEWKKANRTKHNTRKMEIRLNWICKGFRKKEHKRHTSVNEAKNRRQAMANQFDFQLKSVQRKAGSHQ